MKKRVLSLFLALTLCMTFLPTAAFAEGETGGSMSGNTTIGGSESGGEGGGVLVGENEKPGGGVLVPNEQGGGSGAVAKVDDTEYDTLQEILENMSEVEITLLGNVTEDLTVYAATTINMDGFSITGSIDATDSLTLKNGTVNGTIRVDGGTLNMTAPETAEAAITKGLNVISGSCSVSGAKIGVEGTLAFGGTDMVITGTEKAAALTAAAEPNSIKLYGSIDVDGETAEEASFKDGTYQVSGVAAKKLSNQQVGGPAPAEPATLTLDPASVDVAAGKTATFTATYDGTGELNAYIQKNGLDTNFDVSTPTNNGDGTYMITVKIAEETPTGDYTLYVHKVGDTSVKAEAIVKVTPAECSHGGVNGFAIDAENCPNCGAPAVAQTKLNLPESEGNAWRNFADLQTAIDADRTDSDVLRLLTDVSGDYTIDVKVYTGLNLNRHSLNGKVTLTGKNGGEVTFSTIDGEGTVQEVVAYPNAKLANSGAAAVIEKLTLAEGATWASILSEPDRLGYKKYTDYPNLTKYTWYDSSQIDGAELTNVMIQQLPITSNILSITANGKTIYNNGSVERNTEVQLRASCSTSGADVEFYIGKLDDTGHYSYSKADGTAMKSGYYVVDCTFHEIGTYDIYFYAARDGYSVMSEHKTLTVTKLKLSKAKITFTNDSNESVYQPYNATTGAPPYTVTYNDEKLTEGVDYTVVRGDSRSSVGSATLTIKATDDGDYTGQNTARWKVVAHKATISVGNVIKAYDGTTDLPANVAIKLKSADSRYAPSGGPLPLVAGEDYQILSASYDSANASEDEKTISFTIKLKNRNYTFEDGTMQKDFTLNGADTESTFKINQAIIDLNGIQFEQLIYNDLEKEYKIDLKPMLDKLLSVQQEHAGREYGEITYPSSDEWSTDWTKNDYIGGIPSVSPAGILSLPIASANSASIDDQVVKVTLPITTTNYEKFNLTVKVVVGAKIPLDKSGVTVSATDITYGQTLEDSELTTKGAMICPRTKAEIPGTFAWTNPNTKPNAGSYDAEWTFTPDAGYEEYATATGTVTITVSPKSIKGATITLTSNSFEYNGAVQHPEVDSVVLDGETLVETSDYGYQCDMRSDVGTYDFTVFGNNNYTGKVTVKWSITPKTVTPTINVAPCTYTGDALEPEVTLKDDLDNTIDPKEYEVSYSKNTNAGAGMVTIANKDGGNYIIVGRSEDFEINKAKAPTNIQTGTLDVINGTSLTYTYDFSQLLPALSGKASFGDVSYRNVNVTGLATGYHVIGTARVNETTGALTLTLKSVWSTSQQPPGPVGTVSVNVCTTNFEYFLLELNLNAIDQIKPVPDGDITASEITYGDALSKSEISGKMKDPDTGETVNGTFAWQDGTVTPNAGKRKAEWTFTPDAPEYAIATGKVTVTVNPKSIEGAVVTLEDSFVYDGTEKEPKIISVVLDGVTLTGPGRDKDYGYSYNRTTEAGTYDDLEIGGQNNYTGRLTFTWTIKAREVTPTITVADGVYNGGKAVTPAVTLTDDLGKTIAEKEYSVSYENNTNAGTATVTVTDNDGGNYVLSKVSQTFTIGKADAPTAELGSLTITNGLHKTYSFELFTLLPKLTSPSEYGTITYGRPAADLGIGSYVTLVNSKTGVLTLKADRSSTDEGQFGTITVIVSTDNYKDITLTINVSAENKITPQVDGVVTATDITYGQALNDSKITGRMKDGDKAVDGTFAWANGTFKPDASDSYQVAWKFTPNDTAAYAEVAGTVTIKVNKAATTGEPKYTRITTSGKTLADAELTLTGSTLKPDVGKLEWVDDKGNVPPDDATRVEANKTYKWRFTPDDGNYTTLTGEIELYHVSSGGSGSGSGSYTITIKDAQNGDVTTDRKSASAGTTVTITVKPDSGYVLDDLTVTDSKGNDLKITGKGSGKYTFTMPSGKVTVEASFAPAKSENPFTDVPSGAYYEDAVIWAVKNGITGGTSATTFDPNGICTRAQAVTFLWRAAGSPAPKSTAMPFTDVPAGSYYYDAVLWAIEKGITKGTSDTTFSPNANCSRGQIVTFLWRSQMSPDAAAANPFTDVAADAYYTSAVLWAVEKSITGGTSATTFSPSTNCTRAQIVTFLYRVYQGK